MRPDRVVVPAPAIDQHLRLSQAVEDLTVKQLVTQLAVEALDVAILSRAARLDVKRLHVHTLKPITHRRRGELATVV